MNDRFAREVEELEREWCDDPRWRDITRRYTAEDVVLLRGSIRFGHPVARHAAQRLWEALGGDGYVNTFGALTGAQAVQMVKAGLRAIYVSGWQVAADMNLAYKTYPDQSLYPSNSVPALVERINNALRRADEIEWARERRSLHDWFVPIVADAEAGFGGPLHAFELMKRMIEAGAAGVHFEDQLASAKKCGHLGGKVLVPTVQFINTLTAARLAADVLGVPTVLIARTDALSARYVTSDIDPADREFLTGERTPEGHYVVREGLKGEIIRSKAYAPYADVLWFESSRPDIDEARAFAEAIHEDFPGKILAYNCSPSFNWSASLTDAEIAVFQRELGAMGYKFQFITLAGWHLINHHTFRLALDYSRRGMPAYVELQDAELAAEQLGYTATRHQQEVGTAYFDRVLEVATQDRHHRHGRLHRGRPVLRRRTDPPPARARHGETANSCPRTGGGRRIDDFRLPLNPGTEIEDDGVAGGPDHRVPCPQQAHQPRLEAEFPGVGDDEIIRRRLPEVSREPRRRPGRGSPPGQAFEPQVGLVRPPPSRQPPVVLQRPDVERGQEEATR